jgi:DNA-binding NarL/FixJ family response regulator/class 3 adenylate cyclase
MTELPTGTVTLLFTDLEGSTQLVRELGDDYATLLADHRRLLREAASRHGGHEVDSAGDGSFMAFQRARDGLSAAAEAKRLLDLHDWPCDVLVRTRMGIHTGEPQQAEEGYLGTGVHLAARLCASAGGGQILVSESTRAIVRDDLPEGIELLDLGERALKDFARALPVYELMVSGGDEGASGSGARRRPLRVVLAEDSVLLREGIAQLLEGAGFEVAGQVDNGDDLVRRVGFARPDVAIVDIRMPPTHTDEGLQAARRIRERYPSVGVLVLSQYVEPEYATTLLSERTEGTGYLLKDRIADVHEFTEAVSRVAAGGSALDPAVVSQLVGRRRAGDPLDDLTPREREVLQLMAEGLSNQGIAERLVVTERAVEKHVTNIFAKLGLTATSEDHRRVRAVLAYLGVA